MSPRQRLPEPSSGITRIDQEVTRTHGWVGRMGYRRTANGWRPRFKKFFGDFTHGGPADALKAAETWLRRTKRGVATAPASRKTATKRKSATKKRAARKGTARRATAKKSSAGKRSGAKRATRRR